MALLLRESHLRELLAMRELIPLMARTLATFSTGGAVQPLRAIVPVERHGAFLGVMPAYLAPSAPEGSGAPRGPDTPRDAAESEEALGLKAVAVYPGNAAHHLPTHLATILLLVLGQVPQWLGIESELRMLPAQRGNEAKVSP